MDKRGTHIAKKRKQEKKCYEDVNMNYADNIHIRKDLICSAFFENGSVGKRSTWEDLNIGIFPSCPHTYLRHFHSLQTLCKNIFMLVTALWVASV